MIHAASGPQGQLWSDGNPTSDGLTRREYLAGAAALALTAGSGMVQAATTAPTRAPVPLKGGHLVMGLSGANPSDRLDPASHVGSFMTNLAAQYSDTLTTISELYQVRPALATSWDARPGAAEWTIKLRRGVIFHNGKELTAADVIHSINHHRNPATKSVAYPLVAAITDIWDSDKYEVTIALDGGNADLPYLLADQHLAIHPDQSDFADGIGTGAFVLETFKPGVRGAVRRNPNDWRSDRGHLAAVDTVAIADPAERLFAVQSGVVHIVDRVDPRALAGLDRRANPQVFNTAGSAYASFAMFADTPPFDRNDLRLALKFVIDRSAIVNTALGGGAKVANDHPIPSFHPFHASDIPQRSFDPDRARFHYRQSGHRGALRLAVADAAFPGAVEVAKVFQASAAKAGITIEVTRAASEGYWSEVWLKQPFAGAYWPGRMTADEMLSSAFASTSPSNDSHWNSPRFDELLLAARAELDAAKRKRMYRDMQVMLHNESGAVIPCFYNNIVVAHQRVRGYVPHPAHDMSGFRAAEKLWFAT
ncbi:MAG: ABC transporter substrate-binding protein [Alphaproteobacteria bacterium]|nr:ABC transporter substrate-binding protein [Alphaproteobacteria bacterium]